MHLYRDIGGTEMLHIKMQKCAELSVLFRKLPFIGVYIQISLCILMRHLKRDLHISIGLV